MVYGSDKPNGVSNGNGTTPARKPVTVQTLRQMKADGQRIAMLTAYDSSFASLEDACGVDVILVGDSLGNVIQGKKDTLSVTLDDIVYHTKAVSMGLTNTLLVADLPFVSVLSVKSVIQAGGRLLSEAGAAMVKLEGGSPLCLEMIRALTTRSIPVCAHLGLTPQSVHSLGGYRVQGKDVDAAERILEQAQAVEAAGASLLVLECVPESLAERITKSVGIPTIGIGAGSKCDGQVLVIYDLLGITPGKRPKFCKNFLQGRDSVADAIKAYVQEVRDGTFPAKEHTYH
ncbi:hypothetical protein AAVH_06413 [Aphelenchoides avenae]|nr:hypothetical protein AAVH_06413 [Aphelenchus avenae]